MKTIDLIDGLCDRPKRAAVWRALRKPVLVTSGMPAADQLEEMQQGLTQAARAGRVLDLGTMEYAESREVSNRGLAMLNSGLVDYPFSKPFLVLGDTSFDPDQAPAMAISLVIPTEERHRIISSEASLCKNGQLLFWSWCGYDHSYCTVLHDGFPHLRPPDQGNPAGAYVVGVHHAYCAIAVTNTRGIPYRTFSRSNAKAGRTVFATDEYFSSLRPAKPGSGIDHGNTHRSPVAHVRRGHVRTLANGSQTWVRDCLVNCRSEDELAFAEGGRTAYRV